MPYVLRSSLLLLTVTSAGLAASWLINARTLESVRPVPAVEAVAFRPFPSPGRFEKDDVLPAVAAGAQPKAELAQLPSHVPVPTPRYEAVATRPAGLQTRRADARTDFQSCLPACETRDRLAEANSRFSYDNVSEIDGPADEWGEAPVPISLERPGEFEILRAIATRAMQTTRRIVEAPMAASPFARW